MQIGREFYRWFTWLSGDVVVGAIAGMLFFSKLLRTDISWEIYGLLGVAVWCIYTLDHLLDSRTIPFDSPMDRHLVHRIYSKSLWWMLGGIAGIGIIWAVVLLGFGLEFQVGVGLILVVLGGIYWIRKQVKSLIWIKELFTAVFYVVGISWYSWLQFSSVDFRWELVAITLIYVLLAFLNLLMLSSLDLSKDKRAGFHSLATLISPKRLIPIIRKLALGVLLMSFFGFIFFFSFYRLFSCILLLMGLIHYLSFFNASLRIETIRMRMEAAFWLPLILLFV
jgi:hypothetical protein